MLTLFCFQLVIADEKEANEKDFAQLTKDIYGYLRLDQWIDYVKRIKTEEDIPTFYQFESPTDQIKSYYRQFDILGYDAGLKEQMMKQFSLAELKDAHKTLQNPFVTKILNLLFSKNIKGIEFPQRVILAKDYKVDEKRLPLVKSVYNLLLYQTIVDQMIKVIQKEEKNSVEADKIIQQDNENTKTKLDSTRAKIVQDDVEHVFLTQIDQSLQNIAVNELRQFVNILKNKSTAKLVSLYNNYDYFFFYKFNIMLKMKNDQAIKSGLKAQ